MPQHQQKGQQAQKQRRPQKLQQPLHNNSIRIQKFIANNSSFSRRKAEEMILEGRIFVNGIKIVKQGTTIDPKKDIVEIDGSPLLKSDKKIYLMLNKPAGFTCTRAHFKGEKSIMSLINISNVYPVGRLDKDTEGLLLLTNDGDFAYKLTHPKFEHDKEYIVHVNKFVSLSDKLKLEKGVILEGKKTSPCEINNIKKEKTYTSLNIIIHEGRKRQIKKMFDIIGNEVIYLKRIRVANILLGTLEKGETRPLTPKEISSI